MNNGLKDDYVPSLVTVPGIDNCDKRYTIQYNFAQALKTLNRCQKGPAKATWSKVCLEQLDTLRTVLEYNVKDGDK